MRHGQRFAWCYLILTLVWVHLSCTVASAQPQLEYLSSTTGGPVSEVVWYDGFVIGASGASLCVFDSRPGKPVPYKRVYDKALGSRINDIVLQGSALFLAHNNGNISRWDLHNPMVPLPNGIFKPTHFSGSANDISIRHDSLFVAYTDRIVILKEMHNIGAQFEVLGEFGLQTQQGGHITGGALKRNWYAMVTGWQGRYYQSSLQLYDINTKERIHFYPRSYSNARDVVWDEQYPLLHILGGTHTKGDTGLYFAVMVGDRGGLREVFADTIPNGDVTGAYQNRDTLFLAMGKGSPEDCPEGVITAYRVQDSVRIERLGKIRVGFGQAMFKSPMQLLVAGGNSGIFSLNRFIPKNVPCGAHSPYSQTPTGGGNTSADVYGDRMVLASPGYGLSFFNISNPRNPVPSRDAPIAPDAHVVRYSKDGKYLYLLEKGKDQNRVVIREASSFKVVGQTSGPWGFQEAAFLKGRMYILRESRDGIDIIDLRKPQKPIKERSILMPINDLFLDNSGRMVVSSRHNLRVFDIEGSEVSERLSISKWDNGFGKVTIWEDHIFVDVRKKGLVKYAMEKEGGKWKLKELFTIKPPHSQPDQLIADQNHLYVGYSKHGVFALDQAKLHRKGHWPTDPEFLEIPGTGLRDMFLKENFLYVVQFFAQTSILKLKEE